MVPTQSVSFKVSAGDAYRVTLSMSAGSSFEYRFVSDLDINVFFTDPFGAQIGRWERIKSIGKTRIGVEATGVHALVFDNSFSMFTSKSVDLTYRVVPPDGR